MISRDQLKLAAALLRLAADEFSNHGCNDLDLRDLKLESVAKSLHSEMLRDDALYDDSGFLFQDWLAMRMVADWLEREAGRPHPTQPLEVDDKGVVRFKGNKIIKFLFDTGKLDLNEISAMVRAGMLPEEDYVQITQLLGYSVSGWGDLSTSPPDLVEEADLLAEGMGRNGEA